MLICGKKEVEPIISEKIVEISDGKSVYYGGNQEWFNDKILKKVGCSVVAAANLIAYTAFKRKDDKLFNYRDKSKKNFLNLMNETANYLSPNERIGTISTLYFIDKVKKFFYDNGIEVKPEWITTESSYEEFEKFIFDAVNKDKPVMLMLFKNLKLKEFDWHWMTITKIFKCSDVVYISISTWGEKRLVRLYDLYLYSYYGSLISF